MSAVIQVKNQLHEVTREFRDTPAKDFLGLCRRMADSSQVMRVVDLYSDTLFNAFQQRVLLDELSEFLAQSKLTPAEVPIVREVIAALREAYEDGGYVMILASERMS